jgi:hypothetical protein
MKPFLPWYSPRSTHSQHECSMHGHVAVSQAAAPTAAVSTPRRLESESRSRRG